MPFTRPLSRDEGIYALWDRAELPYRSNYEPRFINRSDSTERGSPARPRITTSSKVGLHLLQARPKFDSSSANGVNAIGATTRDSLRARVLQPKDVKQP